MAPLPPGHPPVRIVAPTIVRFTFKHTVGGGRVGDCVVDVSVDEFGTTRAQAVQYVADRMSQPWQDNVLGELNSTVTYTGGHFIDLDSLGGISGDFGPVAGHPTAGGVVASAATSQVALLIKKSSGATRGQRNGRMYLPGVTENDVDNNNLLSGSKVTAMNTKMAALKSAIDGIAGVGPGSTAWRVVHVHKGDPLDPATWTWSSSDVTSAICDNKVATQRRRLR